MRIVEDGGARVELDEVEGIQVHTWIGRASIRTIDAYYDELEAIVNRGVPYVLITDASRAGVPGADVRAQIGVRHKALEPRMQPLNLGNVVVVQSPLLRGALTALTWIIPSLTDIEYAATLDEAMHIARGMQRHDAP